jgi:hypothetical protein
MGSASQSVAEAYPLGRRLIDDTGEIWPLTAPEIRARLNTNLSDEGLVDYLLLNLGWIEISTAPSRSSIRCRPRVVTERGLATLLYMLFDAASPRILLSVFGTDWQHSIHRTVQGVSTIIGGMQKSSVAAASKGLGPALLNREIDPRTSPLFSAYQAVVPRLADAQRMDDIAAPLDTAFGGRWCVCHVEAPTVIVDQVGQGFTLFNPAWHQQAMGPSLDRYADAAYGAWIASQRLEIAASRKTVFDQVDAIVNFPRLGETRLRYARATFPVSLADGTQYIVSAAASDSAINLRN